MSPLKKKIELKLSPSDIAGAFAEMADEDQAQFFIEVSSQMESWGHDKKQIQLLNIADHLRKCSCSNTDTRDMLRDFVSWLGEE